MVIALALVLAVAPPAPPRSATNLCTHALFYTWQGENLPTPAHILPALFGERFEVVAGPRRTLENNGYYETTIPVAAGWGFGEHYWVSERCFVLQAERGKSSST